MFHTVTWILLGCGIFGLVPSVIYVKSIVENNRVTSVGAKYTRIKPNYNSSVSEKLFSLNDFI